MINPGRFTQGNTRDHGLDQTAMLSGKSHVFAATRGLHDFAGVHERTPMARRLGRPWRRRRHARFGGLRGCRRVAAKRGRALHARARLAAPGRLGETTKSLYMPCGLIRTGPLVPALAPKHIFDGFGCQYRKRFDKFATHPKNRVLGQL